MHSSLWVMHGCHSCPDLHGADLAIIIYIYSLYIYAYTWWLPHVPKQCVDLRFRFPQMRSGCASGDFVNEKSRANAMFLLRSEMTMSKGGRAVKSSNLPCLMPLLNTGCRGWTTKKWRPPGIKTYSCMYMHACTWLLSPCWFCKETMHHLDAYTNIYIYITWMFQSSPKSIGHCYMKSFLIPLQKEFITRIQVIKERMSEKSKETWGRWMTEERMRKDKDLNLSNKSILAIKAFCDKFPETHKRPDWEKSMFQNWHGSMT